MKFLTVTLIMSILSIGVGAAETIVYECTVEHSVRLRGGHAEEAGPKTGSPEDPDRVFAMELSSPKDVAGCDKACRMKQTLREVATTRERKSSYDLCESGGKYVLMHPYSAHAIQDRYSVDFRSDRDLGILRLVGPFDHGESYLFWQSGFEYPGCEDTHLVMRKGECIRRKK